MNCEQCGKELPKGYRICPGCGHRLGMPPAPRGSTGALPNHQASNPGSSHQAQINSGTPVQYAGFWLRVAASIIDSLILLAIWLTLMLFFTFVAADMGLAIAAAINAIVSLFYEAYFTSRNWYATPGKRAMKLMVVDTNIQPIGFGVSMGRSLLKITSALTFGIGYLMVALTDKKQALHDLMVKTLVIRK